MTARTLDDQLNKYLADAHSIEEQALQQMKKAPDLAGDPRLSEAFRAHLEETRQHETLVRQRLEARGASPSKFKDLIMRVGGEGFVLFAKFQPDTPGKLTTHAFSYEALEEASYELLLRVAERAGDSATVEVAARIRDDERAMRERLASLFDRAVETSLAEKGSDDIQREVASYVADAHALEAQAEQMLAAAPRIVGDWPELEQVFASHLAETRDHKRLVGERLDALGASRSRLENAAMRLGAINWGTFFRAHPDTPGKLVGFAYAFEHLEIGAYELLIRTARRAGDTETAQLAERILVDEGQAASKLRSSFDRAAEASLAEVTHA